jgi:hypothetical protein
VPACDLLAVKVPDTVPLIKLSKRDCKKGRKHLPGIKVKAEGEIVKLG